MSNKKPFYTPSVKINRVSTDPLMGTLGVISVDGIPVCYTLERFDYCNTPYLSCIPASTYKATKYENKAKRPEAWRVNNVDGRSDILMHIANTPSQLLGCISLGSSIGSIGGEFALSSSRKAFEMFNGIIGDSKEFKLEIFSSY